METCPHCNTGISADTLVCPHCCKPLPGSPEDELLASSASDPTGLLDRLRTATAGEFTIIRELGRGGMGRVFLAHEIALDRRVALKVLPPALSENAEVIERFQREARTAGKLNHPNIVAVFQVSERAGLQLFTMPYVAGPNLRQVLKQTPQLSAELCRRYLREAADALAFAHGRDVIHRDIKPENMLLEGSRDGRLLLTDFGIAKALDTATTLTRPGDMMGTPYFMSPEQCEGAERVDGRSDQYSLGLVGYEMLAGRFPFNADSLAGIVYKHLHEYPEPLESVRPDVPADLRTVIERAIRKNPDDRFADMQEMLKALGPSKAEPRARRESAQPSKPRLRFHGRRLALGSVLVLAIAATGFVIWQQSTSAGGQGEARLTGITVPAQADLDPSALDGRPALDSSAAALGSEPGDTSGAGGGPEVQSQTPAGSERQGSVAAVPDPSERPDELAGERSRAEEARAEAERARDAARQAGADTIFPARFAEVDRLFAGAESDLGAGRIVTAAVAFATAKRDFEDLESQAVLRLEQLAAAAEAAGGEQDPGETPEETPEVQPADSGQAEAPGAGDETGPAIPVAPDEAITSLIESYRQALQTSDMTRLEQEVYQGAVPRQDAELYNLWFERAENLSVTIEVEGKDIRLDDAEVRIKQLMTFQLARTGEPRNWDMSLRMFFSRTGDGWRLERVER